MNKAALKEFAVYARNKLREDVTLRAAMVGVKLSGIEEPLTETTDLMTFDVGLPEPHRITGLQVKQRKDLVAEIMRRSGQDGYALSFDGLVEEVAYTWFNRMIALRFMEVNDYLPNHIRVLSSGKYNDNVPEIINHVFETGIDFSPSERDFITHRKENGRTRAIDELYNFLFRRVCSEMHALLPELFEKTNDYMELLFEASFIDEQGVIYKLVHDIDERDFDVESEDGTGQVEIIGWLYQFYNIELRDDTNARLRKNQKVTKERLPSKTQLFTPDWIVRYMVENSLGRLWLVGHPNDELKTNWDYYLDAAEQEEEVLRQLNEVRTKFDTIKVDDIKVIDPAMGSGHILVYAFDILMQIYESQGYSQRIAARNIAENNLYGLEIDKRAHQIAYFAIMMKGRQYDSGFLFTEVPLNLYVIQDSNAVDRRILQYLGFQLNEQKRNTATDQLSILLDTFSNAKEYGSILNVNTSDWDLLHEHVSSVDPKVLNSILVSDIEGYRERILKMINTGQVMTQTYDVVVTNPPYLSNRDMNRHLSGFLKKYYPDSKTNLCTVFMEKCNELLTSTGYLAMITQQAWMFLVSYEKLREKIYKNSIVNMIQLGKDAFEEIGGEAVQTTAFIISKTDVFNYISTYMRLVDYNSPQKKEAAFRLRDNRYLVKKEKFKRIPGHPIAYWTPESVFKAYESGILMSELCLPKQGLATADNERFLRLWWEVDHGRINFTSKSIEETKNDDYKWYPYNKGGERRQWYGNYDYLVNWENDGYEIRSFLDEQGKIRSVTRNPQFYFKESITWSNINTGGFSIRYREPGSLFDVAGMSAFSQDRDILFYCLGLLSTSVADYIFKILNPTANIQVGDFAIFPLLIDKSRLEEVGDLTKESVLISKDEWNNYELSWGFTNHPLVRKGTSLIEAYDSWSKICCNRFYTVKTNEEELNEIFINLYGMRYELDPVVDDHNVTLRLADREVDVKSLISYAVGCMFGRYSLDVEGLVYSGSAWDSSKYHTIIPDTDGILPITDLPYFSDDITNRFVVFIKKVYGEDTLEENLEFIADALNGNAEESRFVIRNYFLNDFFEDHCSAYSTHHSGKRPIYWLYDSGKQNGFKALIYMHRYSEQTHATVRVKYLHELQKKYRSTIESLQSEIDGTTNAYTKKAAEERLITIKRQLDECAEYDVMLAHMANEQVAIDLDDGVKVNHEKVQTDRKGKVWPILAKIK